jgi:hypothetical protein
MADSKTLLTATVVQVEHALYQRVARRQHAFTAIAAGGAA